MTRRELLAASAAIPTLGIAAPSSKSLPTAPVAIAKCPSYNEDIGAHLSRMFDQAEAAKIVKGKTVTVKLNLTGSPGLRLEGRALGTTHYTHPKTLAAMIHLLDQAGATRIRLVESAWATAGPLEEYMLDAGWNVRALKAISAKVTFENTNAKGSYRDYAVFRVPGGGEIFPSFHLNRAFEETDVLLSMAKLKNHATCGITLSLKNCFGNTPASIYGDDAGLHEPNERPTKGRLDVCHYGKRNPASVAAFERDPQSPREPTYRMPRISMEVVAARPVDLAFIDGVETIMSGEGPWVKGVKHVQPGVMLMGANGVSTDAVATAVMGYHPRATKGVAPFEHCDNMLLIAEQMGLGTADLAKIEVRGNRIEEVRFSFPGAMAG